MLCSEDCVRSATLAEQFPVSQAASLSCALDLLLARKHRKKSLTGHVQEPAAVWVQPCAKICSAGSRAACRPSKSHAVLHKH